MDEKELEKTSESTEETIPENKPETADNTDVNTEKAENTDTVNEATEEESPEAEKAEETTEPQQAAPPTQPLQEPQYPQYPQQNVQPNPYPNAYPGYPNGFPAQYPPQAQMPTQMPYAAPVNPQEQQYVPNGYQPYPQQMPPQPYFNAQNMPPYMMPPQKKKMSGGAKFFVFLLVLFFIAGIGLFAGSIIFKNEINAFIKNKNTNEENAVVDVVPEKEELPPESTEEILPTPEIPEKEESAPEEEPKVPETEETPEETPAVPEETETPDTTEDVSSDEEPEVAEPKIEPYTDGITINKKPTGSEISAAEVYARVIPSTVTVSAQIPYSDGSTEESVGTGIIITENGFVMTNAHVIGNRKASGVKITINDGTEYDATTVGFDKTTDIAIIKIHGGDDKFTPAVLGDADELSIGEWVLAIGNPGGSSFSGSLTRGIISGLDRSVGIYSANGMTYIQTDAAINPGNSGGPLVNMYGQVIGINSSKIVANYYEGMGFAIPISKAKPIIDELLAVGYVKGRVRLGITGSNVLYGAHNGVEIVTINNDSVFVGTDARVGDIIIALDNEPVSSLDVLANVMLAYAPGDECTITLFRTDDSGNNGKEVTVKIKFIPDEGETQE